MGKIIVYDNWFYCLQLNKIVDNEANEPLLWGGKKHASKNMFTKSDEILKIKKSN